MKKRNHGFLALIVCFPNFLIRWQTQRFHFLIVHDFYAFGNTSFWLSGKSLS